MKKFMTLLILLLSLNSFAQDGAKGCYQSQSALEVYHHLNEDEQIQIEEILNGLDLSANELSYVHYEAQCKGNKISGEVAIDEANLNEEQKLLLLKIGVGYILPVSGFEASLKLGKLNKKTGKYSFAFTLSASTSGGYKLGSFQTFSAGFNYYIPKTDLYIGPVVQLLWINNPLLMGTQNYTFSATGMQMGYEIPVKIGKRTMDIDIHGFATFGGLKDKNPKTFLHWGAGVRVNLPYKKNKSRGKY